MASARCRRSHGARFRSDLRTLWARHHRPLLDCPAHIQATTGGRHEAALPQAKQDIGDLLLIFRCLASCIDGSEPLGRVG